MKRITDCNNCGSDDIQWFSCHEKHSDIQDGRLCMHDIKTVYFLGCNDCSETLQWMNEDQVLALMNGVYFN